MLLAFSLKLNALSKSEFPSQQHNSISTHDCPSSTSRFLQTSFNAAKARPDSTANAMLCLRSSVNCTNRLSYCCMQYIEPIASIVQVEGKRVGHESRILRRSLSVSLSRCAAATRALILPATSTAATPSSSFTAVDMAPLEVWYLLENDMRFVLMAPGEICTVHDLKKKIYPDATTAMLNNLAVFRLKTPLPLEEELNLDDEEWLSQIKKCAHGQALSSL